jgi:hypothetical protein
VIPENTQVADFTKRNSPLGLTIFPRHDRENMFTSLQHLLWWIDTHCERIWNEVNNPENGS